MILSGVTVATLLWGNLHNPYVWVVLIVTLVYGAVGLYDDYLKVTRQSVEGSRGRVRLVIEAVIALVATWVIASVGQAPLSTALAIPFFKNVLIDLGWLFVPFRRLHHRRRRQCREPDRRASTASPSCRS
jgi:phospho-N-acetylmuramoyl-pentapeptide-transferase